MQTLGLISGTGDLPKAVAAEARSQGFRVVAIALEPLADPALADYVDEILWINVGKLGEIIESLKRSGVREAVMAGKVSKELLYKSSITPDLRAVKLLFTLRDRTDDAILLAITGELQREGITLRKTTDFCAPLLTPSGTLTKGRLTAGEEKDIAFGWRMAKEIGRLDIGQTVVVKNQAVMAVEAIEGTDETIRRGGFHSAGGAVVVKVAKPNQDLRFDVPVVGMGTVHAMADVRARVLAVEAGATILLDRAGLIRAAEAAGIAVVGYKPSVD